MNVPGLAGYLAAQQQNQQADLSNVQATQSVMGLQGALQQQAERARLAAREQAYQNAVMNAGPNATPEQLVGIASQYGSPDAVLKVRQAAIDRAAARENRPDSRPEILRLLAAQDDMLPTDPRREMIQSRINHLSRGEAASPTSPLGRLIAERNALPAGHPDRKIYDQAITKFQPGGVQVNINPNDPLIPGKPAQNKVDEGLLDAGMRQQQLLSIERQFKPEFQQLGTRFNALRLSAKDKLGIGELDPGEKQQLTEFSQFKRNSIDALNQYIKSVTGAAMTNAEADRILRGLPNPGTGLFDGDSPVEFEAKMRDAIKQVRLSEARLVYIKRNGMNLGDVPLERMPILMNQRGAELEGLIKKHQPNISDEDLKKMVRRNLAQEFGLVQ